MKYTEPYIHTRNYGCRLRRYLQDGVDMLSLENQCIKVVYALGKGADMVELVHKRTDTDYLWHSYTPLKNANHLPTIASADGSFMDAYAGGWQELFPTHGRPCSFAGSEIGFHGEVCIYPWDMQVLTDTPEEVRVKLSVRCARTPFLLERTVWLKDECPTLYMEEKVTNEGTSVQEVMWSHHPAFGYPFLGEGVELKIKGNPRLVMFYDPDFACEFTEDAEGIWPYLHKKDGTRVDVSRAKARNAKYCIEYGICDVEEGAYDLVNPNTGMGLRMEFDKNIYRNLWVWAVYGAGDGAPDFGRAYVLAVEPWSGMPGNYEKAKANGSTHRIEGGGTLESSLSVTLYQTEE